MKVSVLIPFVLSAALLALPGCAAVGGRYTLDAERTGHPAPGVYYLVTEHPGLAKQPEYPQALASVRTALAQHGYHETSDPSATSLQITFCYGATFDRTEITVWPHTYRTDQMVTSGGRIVGQTQTIRLVNSEQRVAHFNAWFILAGRTVATDGYCDGWSVLARTDIRRHDADRVLPSMVAAATILLNSGTPEAVVLALGPADPAVRAIASHDSSTK